MSDPTREKYKKNIEEVKKNIKRACKKVGRDPGEVLLIAASKYADPKGISEVFELGIKDFGENRAQDLIAKDSELEKSPRWHFIGHLQKNKVNKVVPLVEYIHSIDKVSTLEAVDKAAVSASKKQKILIEVNLSGEKSKYGLSEDSLKGFLEYCKSLLNVKICGLMTVAPYIDDRKALREIFKDMKKLICEVRKDTGMKDMSELSMGMSNDYDIAIEEGATMVRVGSSIFK